MKYLLLFFILSTSLFAKDIKQDFNFESFYKAKTSSNFIHFEMESTKMGMITSSFMGVVKNFSVSSQLKGKTLKNAIVSFKVKDIDTDVNGRNKKMYKVCFEEKKYPHIIITLINDLTIGNSQSLIPATINVRGKNKPIKVMLNVLRKGKKLIVTGVSKVKLSELEIPDPSIWIAKVNDAVELKFNFELNL